MLFSSLKGTCTALERIRRFRMNKALSVCERCSMRDALLHSVPPHRGLRAHFTVFQLRYCDDVVVVRGLWLMHGFMRLNYTCGRSRTAHREVSTHRRGRDAENRPWGYHLV